MAKFAPGQPITTEQSFIDVDAGLPVGTHRFQLVVVDAEGNRSAPDIQTVTVARIPVTPPIVGPVNPVTPISPVTPITPVTPTPIRPIGRTTPAPVRSPQKSRRPQGRKQPRRGGTQ